MTPMTQQSPGGSGWELAARQHGVVSRVQLLELGLSVEAIRHRVARGRLHPVMRGVYAVGRAELSRRGRWMAAVLACGPGAMLSHESAAALWGIRNAEGAEVEVSLPAPSARRRPGIRVHRRTRLGRADLATHHSIPLTSPIRTLLDLATRLRADGLETAINEADKRELVDPDFLRAALGVRAGQPGVAVLRKLLDRRTFTLTDSELERRFMPIALRAGLAPPLTQKRLNGFRVDFFWPDLGLVVETDGLRYHRTAAQQARDRVRDQAHTVAGLTHLRFTHAQVRHEPAYVERVLRTTSRRLAAAKAA
jgi:very-short-patch-repair endonuclease